MRWWNQGAPQTKVSRSIGGGAWSVIQTFGPLTANAYIDFRDLQAAPDTENCDRVAASDGMNAFSALYTPDSCVITHAYRDRPAFRLTPQDRESVGEGRRVLGSVDMC